MNPKAIEPARYTTSKGLRLVHRARRFLALPLLGETAGVSGTRASNVIRLMGIGTCRLIVTSAFLLLSFRIAVASETNLSAHPTLILVIGAPGEAEFGSNFLQQATLWQKAATQGNCSRITIGLSEPGQTNDCDLIRQTLVAEPKEGLSPLWLVMLGHGSFDGKEAKFNLRGPDISATELSLWLKPFKRSLILIDTSSSSAPFLTRLSATNRVIITATRSGHEQNFTRFGKFFAEAITDPASDLDKDGSISVLEAFLMASRQTAAFYKSEGRLASEHALLDDNGDGLGTPADWFQGLRAVKKPKDAAAVDGLLAQQIHLVGSDSDKALTPEQIARRDALERAVLLYREKKDKVPEDEYYRELEKLLLEVARFYGSNSLVSPTVQNGR